MPADAPPAGRRWRRAGAARVTGDPGRAEARGRVPADEGGPGWGPEYLARDLPLAHGRALGPGALRMGLRLEFPAAPGNLPIRAVADLLGIIESLAVVSAAVALPGYESAALPADPLAAAEAPRLAPVGVWADPRVGVRSLRYGSPFTVEIIAWTTVAVALLLGLLRADRTVVGLTALRARIELKRAEVEAQRQVALTAASAEVAKRQKQADEAIAESEESEARRAKAQLQAATAAQANDLIGLNLMRETARLGREIRDFDADLLQAPALDPQSEEAIARLLGAALAVEAVLAPGLARRRGEAAPGLEWVSDGKPVPTSVSADLASAVRMVEGLATDLAEQLGPRVRISLIQDDPPGERGSGEVA